MIVYIYGDFIFRVPSPLQILYPIYCIKSCGVNNCLAFYAIELHVAPVVVQIYIENIFIQRY